MTTTPGDDTAGRGDDTAGRGDDTVPAAGATPAVHTGDPAIDDALDRLDTLDERDVEEHPAVFEHVHRVLRDALSGARPPQDQRPQNAGGP